MKHKDKQIDLLIITWHQTYLSSFAGGYVRLREFLKRMPSNIEFILLDNSPSLYSDIFNKKIIQEYKSPEWINKLQKKAFILWYLVETISSAIILYHSCEKIIKIHKNNLVLYFPTGEFLQLYIVSLLLKIRYPSIRVVLDILNYGILDSNFITYFFNLIKNHIGIIRSLVSTVIIMFSFFLMKFTIYHADYIVTVSDELVKKIKKDYKKSTIGFTPSGVILPKGNILYKQKSYLGVFIGRMTVEKGVFTTLKIWREVIKIIPTAKLAIAGYADAITTTIIKNEIKDLGIENNVVFFNGVSDKEKGNLLAKSELFLHFASREPLFPIITILEGFSYGLPVVCFEMSVINDAIKEFKISSDSIYAVENGNINKAAEQIISYFKLNEKDKDKKSKSAINNTKLFSWDKIAEKEFNIIKSLMKNI